MATIKDLKSWIERDLTRFSDSKDCVLEIPDDPKLNQPDDCLKIRIFTDTNRYGISAAERDDDGYLGCIASSRKPRAGEDWTRGRDLADGDLSEETWHEILGDIVSYEMVKIHKKVDGPTVSE